MIRQPDRRHPQKMNIAYLINQYPAPSQPFIRREIAALEARGWNVTRYSLRDWGQTLADEADETEKRRTRFVLGVGAIGLMLALLKVAGSRPAKFARALKRAISVGLRSDRGAAIHLVYLAEACVLLGWLVEGEVGHVHAHFGTNSTSVAMLCRVLGGPPYSFTVHGPDEFDSPRGLALREKVAGATFVAAISEYTRSQLYRWADFADWKKIRVVRCGVDASFQPSASLPPCRPRLVCVGRLAEQKGQLVLIQAAAILSEDGIDFELVLVGDGPMRSEIEALIARLGLGRNVVLAGWKSGAEVRRAILESRALVLPSFAEGLPVVLMESLALGRPVVTTYIAGIPELIRHGVNGWLVPAGSVADLAHALREVLAADPDDLARMGRDGAARVAEFHSDDREASKLAALFSNPSRADEPPVPADLGVLV